MAKRKIAQRHQKRSSPSHTCQQSTQTDAVVLRRANSLRVLNTGVLSAHRDTLKSHRDTPIIDGESQYYEDRQLLCERLFKTEQVRPTVGHGGIMKIDSFVCLFNCVVY